MNIYYKNSKKMAKSNAFLFQGNTKNNIPRSTFDFSKTNSDTMNFGELKIGQWFETIAKDSVRGGVSESVIAAPLTAPANVRVKHVNKSFYLPNTILWKYWDEFCMQRPNGMFTNSRLAEAVKEQKPWVPPSINFGIFLYPLIAFAKGFFIPDHDFYIPTTNNLDDKWYSFSAPDRNPNDGYASMMLYNDYVNDYTDPSDTSNYITFYGTNFKATDLELTNGIGITDGNVYSSDMRFLRMSSHFVINRLATDTTGPFNDYFSPTRWQNLPEFEPIFFQNLSSDRILYANYSLNFNRTGLLTLDDNSAGRETAVFSPSSFVPLEDNTIILNGLNSFSLPLPSHQLARQYGMSRLALLYYCAQSAVRLLEGVGINYRMIEGSLFSDLLSVEVNALPFFSYQKIFNDHFSNKSIDFAQIDYSYANGPIFDYSSGSISMHDILSNINGVDSKVLDHYRTSTALATYGWNLPLLNLPRNYNSVRDIYLNLTNNLDVFNLLLGFNIDSLIHFDRQDDSNFSTLLPSFDLYHGLLHTQYVNFAPDYFTTAQFDPTQGNEQVSVPSTITQLREANALQEFFDANQWTRSIGEWLNSHFDSYSKYVGLTDAEFLGSSETNVVISEQLQTSESTDSSALGERAGVAQGYQDSGLTSFLCGENGIFMCVHYVVMETSYVQGLQKKLFAKSSYLDYPFPEFANLSPESINVLELCVPNPRWFKYKTGGDVFVEQSAEFTHPKLRINNFASRVDVTPASSSIFGYTPRYSAYKFQFDEVKGEFLSNLDYWSDFRFFFDRPCLGHSFISYELSYLYSNLNKIFAIYDDSISDHFYVNQLYNYEVTRSLPVIVKPSL